MRFRKVKKVDTQQAIELYRNIGIKHAKMGYPPIILRSVIYDNIRQEYKQAYKDGYNIGLIEINSTFIEVKKTHSIYF